MTSERIKEIQQQTAYPDSISVQQALLQVWNECSQLPQQQTFVSKGHPSVISENGNELLFDKEGNLIKELPQQETLYTEEQVREAIRMARREIGYGSNYEFREDVIIQSLKRKKDLI